MCDIYDYGDCEDIVEEVSDCSDELDDFIEPLSLEELQEARDCLEEYQRSEMVDKVIDEELNLYDLDELYELRDQIDGDSDDAKVLSLWHK